MANLDNFFAKKDKKKKGKGKKFTGTSTAEMVKALETPEEAPPPEAEKREFQIDLPSSKSTDDDWHEVEEKEKDLEGLKIRSLRVDDGVEEPPAEKPVEKLDEDSDSIEGTPACGSSASPWQVPTEANDPEPEEEVKTEPEPKPESPSPSEESAPKRYVPPNMRNSSKGDVAKEPYRPPGYAQRGTGRAYCPPGRRHQAPPDILNPDAFPTLGGTANNS